MTWRTYGISLTNANNVKEVIKIHPMSIKNDVGPEGKYGLFRMDFNINVLE